MSDDTTPESTESTEAAASAAPARRPTVKPVALSHASDHVLRPGFRNPDTPKSLSQKKAKKKKK